MSILPFSHPGMERFRPEQAPEAQREAATAAYNDLRAEPFVDRVTTEIPRRGGVACMVAWEGVGEDRRPVGYLFITPEGEVTTGGQG